MLWSGNGQFYPYPSGFCPTVLQIFFGICHDPTQNPHEPRISAVTRVLASPKFLPTDSDLCSSRIRRTDRNRQKKVIIILYIYNIMYMLTRQIWGIWKLRPASSPETPNLGQIWWCFVPCDLEIWWMTLENNRASLLCCFKLCATFHSHRWIQNGVTVRKRPIWVKFDDF